MAHVQTALGPILASELGFTLPHEHTVCYLWHIPGRWDYWELTPDEAILTAEIESFQRLGGTCLVDATPVGIGRDPLWRPARRLRRDRGLAPAAPGAGPHRRRDTRARRHPRARPGWVLPRDRAHARPLPGALVSGADRAIRLRGWRTRGATTLAERAADRVDEILASHVPPTIEPSTAAAVHAVVERASQPVTNAGRSP